MSELSFNDLPFEILAKLFRLLDVVSLKNATLTCKMWKNVIEYECPWPLYYGALSSKPRANFALTTDRKVGTIKIAGIRLSVDNKIGQILQRHSFNVVKLILHQCHIQNLNQFADFLSLTTNLEHIVVNRIHLEDASDVLPDHALPALKKLKNLEIDCSHQWIITCFQNAKLRTIKIWEDQRWWPQRTHGALVEFLLSQEMLTSLTVFRGHPSGSIFAKMGKPNVPNPFRLTHLAVSSNVRREMFHDDDDDNNLLRFVESQAKHLKRLELGFGIPSIVYECAFTTMTKLNSLSVLICRLPKSKKFYDRLKDRLNCSLPTMELLDYSYSVDDYQCVANFYKKLPNISGFESLSISFIDSRTIHCVKFPNLQALDIQYLCGKIDWNEFTKAYPLLTELTIGKMDEHSYLTSDDIDRITTNVDLHSIRLGVGFIADDRFFEIVRAKCTNLKMLELHESCVPHGLNYNVGINVLLLCNHSQYSKCSEFSLDIPKF